MKLLPTLSKNGVNYFPAIIAVVIILLLLHFKVEAQVEQKINSDTVLILSGKAQLILPCIARTEMKRKELIKQYSAEFQIDKVQLASGFDFGKNTTYRFFYTDIDNRDKNDGGFATWKLIEMFTNKIQDSEWIKSGFTRTSNGTLYFVNLVYPAKGGLRFSKFVFFNIDGKLAFGQFQCSENELCRWEPYCDMEWNPTITNSLSRSNSNRPRFSAL